MYRVTKDIIPEIHGTERPQHNRPGLRGVVAAARFWGGQPSEPFRDS
jgi:hypothetical protein